MRTLVLHLGPDIGWALFEAPDAAPVRAGTGAPTFDGAVDRCWVLVPGADATTHSVALPKDASERRAIAAAAFALEDALAVDPGELHFALGPAGTEVRTVTLACRTAMSAWMARLAALGVKADILAPDYMVVADTPVIHEGLVLARTRDGGFAAEPDLAALVLENTSLRLPSMSTTELLTCAYAKLLHGAPVNLLQGAYAPKRDWSRVLSPWRRVGALAAGVAIAVIVGIAADGVRLSRQAEAATARAEAIFRAAFPDTKRVVNPRAQMRAYLQGAGLTGESGFLALSEVIIKAVSDAPEAEITALRFDGKRGEIAATFSLPSFEAVERLKSGISAHGGRVQEGGARQDGQRILTDMIVRRP